MDFLLDKKIHTGTCTCTSYFAFNIVFYNRNLCIPQTCHDFRSAFSLRVLLWMREDIVNALGCLCECNRTWLCWSACSAWFCAPFVLQVTSGTAAVLTVIISEVPTAPARVTEVKVTCRIPSMHHNQSASLVLGMMEQFWGWSQSLGCDQRPCFSLVALVALYHQYLFWTLTEHRHKRRYSLPSWRPHGVCCAPLVEEP